MSLKGRFRNLAAAFLMVLSTVAPMGGVSIHSTYAAVGDDAPGNNKQLIDNGDGTYTIALSVTGAQSSSSTTNVTKANVVLVIDTSNSMNTRTSVGGVSRLEAEKNALTQDDGIIDNLLAQNVPGDANKSDIIEVAIANFSTGGHSAQGFTTSGTTLKTVINGLTTSTGTNWEEGLQHAKAYADSIKASQPNEDVYIIFLTDGEPTTDATRATNIRHNVNTNYAEEWGYAKDEARAMVEAGYKFYSLFTWGSGDSSHYLSSLVQYAYTGNGDSNSNLDSAYAEYFTDASDTATLISALTQIVENITTGVGYTNVELTDGVTEMTSSNIKAVTSGAISGIKYYRSGGSYSTTDNNGLGEEWTDAPDATVNEDGVLDWNLGNLVLDNGVTYTVAFVVWPSQESLNLVADLNNGKIDYDSLTDEQKGQITGSEGSYTLKTNTDFPTLTYSTITTTTIDGRTTTVISDPKTVDIDNPDPVALASKKLDIVKLWEDGLDPSQQEDYKNEVTLDLYIKDNGNWSPYESNIKITKDGEAYSPRWTADKKVAVAPGIMISVNSETGQKLKDSYPVIDGYVILEQGHDYELREDGITHHYYLTNYQYHPMLVDGEMKNVTFEYNDEDEAVSIKEINNLSVISATNTLKGGIDVTKEVTGREDVSNEKFTISTIFEDSKVERTYRIIYGENNPCSKDGASVADCADEEGSMDRSKKKTVSGTLTAEYYVGDIIRFIDVDTGTKFKVEEDTSKLGLGYSFDGVEHKITHNAKDAYVDYLESEKDGDWYIVQKNASSRATVKNIYDATTLKISKTIDVTHGDRDAIKAKTFGFKVTLKDGDEELAGEYGYTTNKNNSGTIVSGGTITLGDGEIATIADLPVGAKYTVEELGANEGGFTTTVSGEESGTLAKAGAEVAYTNTYNAKLVSTQIIALKDFNDWTSDDIFYFTLKENGNVIGKAPITVPVSEETNKQATFNVTYDEPGTYNYTIEESTEGFSDRNITSTPNVLTVTVKVVDNGEGALEIAKGYPKFEGDAENNNTITNTYESTGSLQLYASKILTGRDWKEGDVFTFQLFAKDGETETQLGENVTIDYAHRNDSVAFSTINYSTGDSGTRVYVIREVTDNLPAGVTAQTGEVTINVTLTDNHNGSITTNFDADEYTAQLTNVYGTTPTDPAEAVLKVKKTITDLTNSKKDGTFTFQLQNKDGSKVQEKEFTTENLTGEASFNGISFNEAGTYEYKIVEIAGTEAGFTYDETVHNVVIVVKDNTDAAKLYVDSIKIDGNAGTTAEFTNVYEADASDAKVKFDIAKTLTGFEGETPATFTFNMKGDDTDTQTIKGSGTASFKELTYDKAGKHTYTISEQKDNAPGYSYDQTVYTVTVDVVDENAKLVPKVEIKKGEEVVREIKFENTYSASGKASLQITKAFAGDDRDWSKESFEFELTGDGIDEAMTATANADGNWVAAFDEITYDKAGKYKYTITEKDSGLAGVTASGPVEVTVSVVDNGNGTLTATPEYTKDATITNIYDTASVDVSLVVRKMIENQSGSTVDGTFSFELSGEGYNDTVEVTTRGGVGGSNTFKTITYDKVGEYRYTLTEKNDGKPGFTYDEKQYEVVVTVTDDVENAQLKAKVVMNNEENNGITITNVYKAEPVSVQFDVTKTLNGMNDGIEPVEFEFKLTGDDIEEQTVKIKGAGSESFKEITFDKVGTYHFEIVEVDGKAAGYIYDLAKFIIEVSVKDENGKLVADVTITKDGESASSVNFVNSYEAKPVEDYQIGVVKELEGRELKEGEFSFTLYDADGNEVETTLNDADGFVTFSGLTFDKPGTYVFTVKENIDENKGDIEYDTNEYTITIVVKDDGEGSLYVESDDSTEVVFNNKWNEPGHGEDLPPSPNTEDDIVNSIALFSMSVIGLIGAIIFGKRKAAEEE